MTKKIKQKTLSKKEKTIMQMFKDVLRIVRERQEEEVKANVKE